MRTPHALRHGNGLTYFPALAVPVGEEDELVCPPEHVEFLKAKLSDADGIHLLVIGYSGYDREVIRVLQEAYGQCVSNN